MSNTNTGGPAFPSPYDDAEGMTLRDYFAAKADVSVYEPLEACRRKLGRLPTIGELAEYIAAIRHTEADAMLKAREQCTS